MLKKSIKRLVEEGQKELAGKLALREVLDAEIAELRQSIGGLLELVNDEPITGSPLGQRLILDEIKLVDACREVLRASTEYLSPAEVKDGLVNLGYDISDNSNITASIHTTLRRLVESGEAEEDKAGKKAFRLKRRYGLMATLMGLSIGQQHVSDYARGVSERIQQAPTQTRIKAEPRIGKLERAKEKK